MADQRTTKGPGRRLPSARSLTGRRGYFPVRTGRRQGIRGVREQLRPPEGYTLPEWVLELTALRRGLRANLDFFHKYQISDLGVNAEVDFYFAQHLVVEVQGFFWHQQFGGFARFNDQVRRARLEAAGYPTIFIDEDNLVGPRADPDYYLAEALQGRDRSLLASF